MSRTVMTQRLLNIDDPEAATPTGIARKLPSGPHAVAAVDICSVVPLDTGTATAAGASRSSS